VECTQTTESELKHFFSAFGPVRDCKIIVDRVGASKWFVSLLKCHQDSVVKIQEYHNTKVP